MYWIKIKKLKHELQTGSFTERDAIPYIIAGGILVALIPLTKTNGSVFDLIAVAYDILIIVLGTWYVFKQHNPDSASSFLAKYISLSWVVGFRCFLIFIPLMILSLIPVVVWVDKSTSGWFPLVWEIIFSVVYYYRLGKNVSET